VGVGIGDQGEAVEGREPPVHRRVGGKTGFQGEDVLGLLLEAFLHGVEPGEGAEKRIPRRPHVRRDDEGLRGHAAHELDELLYRETEDGPAVSGQVPEPAQGPVDLPGLFEDEEHGVDAPVGLASLAEDV